MKGTGKIEQNNMDVLIEEMVSCVRNFTSEKVKDLEAYIAQIALCQGAQDKVSQVCNARAASTLEQMARDALGQRPDLSHEQAFNILRLKLLAQVFREGFSPKINQAIAALFGKGQTLPPDQKEFITDLRAERIPEGDSTKRASSQKEEDHNEEEHGEEEGQ